MLSAASPNCLTSSYIRNLPIQICLSHHWWNDSVALFDLIVGGSNWHLTRSRYAIVNLIFLSHRKCYFGSYFDRHRSAVNLECSHRFCIASAVMRMRKTKRAANDMTININDYIKVLLMGQLCAYLILQVHVLFNIVLKL